MASSIDTTKPVSGTPTTASVRQNFTYAKSEIEALQSGKADLASPALTGTATAVNLTVSGTLNASGTLQVGGVAVTATAAELNILDGVTATAAELNILDGVTATAAELNILDGVTATTAELNKLDGVLATTAELNILDGVTATAAELNILDGVTSTAAELNILDGVLATTAEINYLSGVTSAIQTQLDAKLTGNQTITLSGDATGSGTTAITVTVDMSGLSGTTYAAGNGSAITNVNAASVDGFDIVETSQAAYDALSPPDANTIYFITS